MTADDRLPGDVDGDVDGDADGDLDVDGDWDADWEEPFGDDGGAFGDEPAGPAPGAAPVAPAPVDPPPERWDPPPERWDPPPERPSPAPPPPTGAERCWNCGHPVQGGVDPCPVCLGPRAHLVLTLDSPRLRAVAAPGRPLRLGRDQAWAPETAPGLAGARGVSRRHATVTVDHDGAAWVAEATREGSLNGTWVNGHRVDPAAPRRLNDRDELGLGRRVLGTVRLRGDPGPSPAP